MDAAPNIDDTDRRLLEIVLADPRVGVREFSRRLGVARTNWASSSGARNEEAWRTTVSYGAKPAIRTVAAVAVGDRVLHTSFGMGRVIATQGSGEAAKADVDFGSVGVKRLSLRHAPMEKL